MYAEHEGLEGLGWPSLGSPHRKDEEKDGQECPSYKVAGTLRVPSAKCRHLSRYGTRSVPTTIKRWATAD